MIETESQRQAALSWIRYWKESVSVGEQSWLGQEQALETIMALHRQVDAYEKRVQADTINPLPVDIQDTAYEAAAPEQATKTELRDEELVFSIL
ncbi:MAG TPA: hypothetical protein VF898_13600 [Chloroflexota bacterium]